MKTVLIVDERIEHNLKMVNEVIESVPLKFDMVQFPIEAKTGRQKRRERRKQERKN